MGFNMANSKIMNNAKVKKDDEYFTLYDDIANEIPLYKEQLKGKRIICPCDWDESFEETVVYSNGDEIQSDGLFSEVEHIKNVNIQETSKRIEKDINLIKCNFIKFLVSHAEDYEIKSISVSGYDPSTGKGIKFQDINYKNYDLVITNPPFSQITEFFDVMIKNNMEFLVIGPQTALGYKDSFKYLRENKMWLGYAKQLIGFSRPSGEILLSKNSEGSVPRACKWFTNLDVKYRHDELILTEKYSDKYIHYDNFNGIDVNETKNIPYDYEGCMGVPITFIQKYNPEQFEIIGFSGTLAKPIKDYANPGEYQQGGPAFYTPFSNEKYKYHREFPRIVIKNKKVRKDED